MDVDAFRLTQIRQEANWYKPAPGEPYRPLIAMPSKIRQAHPWLNFCGDAIFTAYDPPHALGTEAALIPPSSAGDPKLASLPSPTQDPGTRATVVGKGSTTLRPAIVPTVDEPTATPNPSPSSNKFNLTPDPQSNDPSASETSPDDIADPFVTTIDNQAVTAAPTAVEFAGTTLTPGAPGTTIAGTLISLNPAGQLVVGSTTVTLPGTNTRTIGGAGSGGIGHDQLVSIDSILTTIAQVGDQRITAAPTAVAFAGTTLTPGATGQTISGTLISLNTAGQLVIGAQTIPFETSSVGLGRLIMGGFGVGGPLVGGGTSPSPSIAGNWPRNVTSGNRTTANAVGTVFRGEAESLRIRKSGRLVWMAAAVSAVAIWVLIHWDWWSLFG